MLYKVRWLRLITLMQLILLTQCVPAFQSKSITLQQTSTVSFEIVNEDSRALKDVILQSKGAQDEWQQKVSFFRPEGKWGGWVTQLKVESGFDCEVDRYVENPIRVPAQAEVHGFFLVRNAWKKPHDLGVIFLLDFQQMTVIRSDGRRGFYDLPVMEPQEDRAFEFALPELLEGVHQLSVLLIADADNLSTDKAYRRLQQGSFSEIRYDLWVGIERPPEDIMLFENTNAGQEQAQAASSRVNVAELVASPGTEISKAVSYLTLEQGETHRLGLCFFNAKQKSACDGSVPMNIAVFWDDRMKRVLEYNLPADAPDNLTLELEVEAPTEPGLHQLNVIAFTFPGYSQFGDSVERILYPRGLFSQRVLVAVR